PPGSVALRPTYVPAAKSTDKLLIRRYMLCPQPAPRAIYWSTPPTAATTICANFLCVPLDVVPTDGRLAEFRDLPDGCRCRGRLLSTRSKGQRHCRDRGRGAWFRT